MDRPLDEIFEQARNECGLSHGELWLRYFELGGTSTGLNSTGSGMNSSMGSANTGTTNGASGIGSSTSTTPNSQGVASGTGTGNTQSVMIPGSPVNGMQTDNGNGTSTLSVPGQTPQTVPNK